VPTIANRKRNGIPNRHWNPAFRKQRAWKVMKVPLPDFDFDRKRAREEVTPEEVKEKMKKQGIQPMHAYQERPTYVSSAGIVFEPYVPPEGEGKASLMGGELKDAGGQVVDKTKNKVRGLAGAIKTRLRAK
jgi:large subunit ribosomal protein L45